MVQGDAFAYPKARFNDPKQIDYGMQFLGHVCIYMGAVQ